MLLRRLSVAAGLLALAVSAAPQEGIDRDYYARDYVQFLAVQLNQFTKEFPQKFYANLMRPPVDASKLSEAAKASAGELGEALQRLATLAPAKDVLTNAEFRSQLEHTLAVSKQVNEVMGSQRFPMPLQDTWGQLREALNNLARVYKVETLAVLEIPGAAGSGRGRGGRGANAAAAGGRGGARGAVPPGALVGYIVDQMCAKRGKQMWTNAQCVQKCMRDGDKIVLVTEEGKIYQIANQDKITPDTYGLVVAVTGKTEGDTITVENLTM